MRSDRLVQMGVAAALFGMCFTKIGLGTPMSTDQEQIEKGTLQLTSLKAQPTVNNPLADQIYIRTGASQQERWGPYTVNPGADEPLPPISVPFKDDCTVELRYVDKNNSQVPLGSKKTVSLNSPSPGSLTFTGYGASYTLNYNVQKK